MIEIDCRTCLPLREEEAEVALGIIYYLDITSIISVTLLAV